MTGPHTANPRTGFDIHEAQNRVESPWLPLWPKHKSHEYINGASNPFVPGTEGRGEVFENQIGHARQMNFKSCLEISFATDTLASRPLRLRWSQIEMNFMVLLIIG